LSTVVFGRGIFVVNSKKYLYISTDGRTWSEATRPSIDTNCNIKFVGGEDTGLFYWVCTPGPLFYSTDGKSWVQPNLQNAAGVAFIEKPNPLYIGSDIQGGFWTSTDGINWNQNGNVNTMSPFDLFASNGDIILAVSTADNSMYIADSSEVKKGL